MNLRKIEMMRTLCWLIGHDWLRRSNFKVSGYRRCSNSPYYECQRCGKVVSE